VAISKTLTGTGIWAIQFSKRYPATTVVGTDLSVIQPLNVPPNCQFYREDTEEEPWVFDRQFDYIHLRTMSSCFRDPKAMVGRIFRHLRPGGYVEYQVCQTSELHLEVRVF
jgi:ubiquinone/menaquinone biosynthesis C-methylase UbiE